MSDDAGQLIIIAAARYALILPHSQRHFLYREAEKPDAASISRHGELQRFGAADLSFGADAIFLGERRAEPPAKPPYHYTKDFAAFSMQRQISRLRQLIFIRLSCRYFGHLPHAFFVQLKRLDGAN